MALDGGLEEKEFGDDAQASSLGGWEDGGATAEFEMVGEEGG